MKYSDVFLMDGAAGTTLWHLADAAGIAREPVWKYNIEHPELVRELHRRYIDAGSQLIQANTFGANDHLYIHEGFGGDQVVTVYRGAGGFGRCAAGQESGTGNRCDCGTVLWPAFGAAGAVRRSGRGRM